MFTLSNMVGKIPKNVAFSTIFCPIKSDLSSNTVWPQVSGFQKLAKIDHFWHFWWTFVHSKCKRSSLRSQFWMRLFLYFSILDFCNDSNILHALMHWSAMFARVIRERCRSADAMNSTDTLDFIIIRSVKVRGSSLFSASVSPNLAQCHANPH